MTPATNCVVLILDNEIGALHFVDCPQSFHLGDETFIAQFSDDDNGFNDWLRNGEGNLIGVKWFPYEDNALKGKPAAYLRQLSSVVVEPDLLELAIYFSRTRLFIPSASADQDFLKNNLYLSSKGRYAISFSSTYLNERELRSLPIASVLPR